MVTFLGLEFTMTKGEHSTHFISGISRGASISDTPCRAFISDGYIGHEICQHATMKMTILTFVQNNNNDLQCVFLCLTAYRPNIFVDFLTKRDFLFAKLSQFILFMNWQSLFDITCRTKNPIIGQKKIYKTVWPLGSQT